MLEYDRCKRLVKAVESLSKTEIEELFKIIHKKTSNYTRNNNGIFINLAWVPDDIIVELENYVQFCTTSHIELKKYESICDVLNNSIKTSKTDQKTTFKVKQQRSIKQNQTNQTNQNSVTNVSEVLNNIKIKSDIDMNASEEIIDAIEDEPGVYSMLSSSVRYTMFKKKFAKLCYQTRLQDYESDLQKDKYICT